MEMTKTFGEVRKTNRINEYKNTRMPMHVMYCCCRRRGMTARPMTLSLAVSALRVARDCNVIDWRDGQNYLPSMQIFRPHSTFVASFPELLSTSANGYVVQQSIHCCQRWNFVEEIDTEMAEEGVH